MITLHTLSHAKFHECAVICDICSVTASCFEKEIDIWGERIGDLAVEVSISMDGRLFRLHFMDKSNWHPVDWMIWEDDGKLPISCIDLLAAQAWLTCRQGI